MQVPVSIERIIFFRSVYLPSITVGYGLPESIPKPNWDQLYPKFLEFIFYYKLEYGWNQTSLQITINLGIIIYVCFTIIEMIEMKHKAPPDANYFIVQDVGVNSMYASGWGVLSDLAGTILFIYSYYSLNRFVLMSLKFSANYDKNLSTYCKQHQMNAENAILSKLWSKDLNRFISTYIDKNG